MTIREKSPTGKVAIKPRSVTLQVVLYSIYPVGCLALQDPRSDCSPGVSILCLGEIASLICSICLSVAARTISLSRSVPETHTSTILGH